MAVRRGRAQVTISADNSGLKRGVADSEHQLGKLHTSVGKSFGGIRAAVSSGTSALIGGAGLAYALDYSVKAAARAQVSQAKLQAQLKASGISYRAHAQEINNVIQKTSQLSGLDDEDLQDAFTNIVRVTGKVNQSLKLVGLAADFARAKHMDVANAGQIVAKVAGGNVGILSRYGIVLQKGATASQALAELQKRFAGQAQAYGKTAAGSMDRIQVSVENAGEAIGGALLPVLAKAANAFAKFVQTVPQWVAKVKAAITDWVAKNRKSISDFVGSIKQVTNTLGDFFNGFVLPTLKRVVPAIKSILGGLANIVRGFVEIIAGVLTLRFGEVWKGVKHVFQGGIQGVVGVLRGASAPFRQAGAMLGRVFTDAITGAWKGVVKAFTSVINGLIDAYNAIPLVPNIGRIGGGGGGGGRSTGGGGSTTFVPHGSSPSGARPTQRRPSAPHSVPGHAFGTARTAAAHGATASAASVRGGGRGQSARAASSGPLSLTQLASLWVQAGGPSNVAMLMAHVAQAESGGWPNINNGESAPGTGFAGGDGGHTRAAGLWQILGLPFAGNAYDPLTNARMAVAKYRTQGLGAWESSRGAWGRYVGANEGLPSGSRPAALPHVTAPKITTRTGSTPRVTVPKAKPKPVRPSHVGASVGLYGGGGDARMQFIQSQFDTIDQHVQAGDITEAQGNQQKIALIEQALHPFNSQLALSPANQLALRATEHQLQADAGSSTGDSADQSQQDAIDATNRLTAAIDANTKELKQHNAVVAGIQSVDARQALRFAADVLSGQIAATTRLKALSAGAGSTYRA